MNIRDIDNIQTPFYYYDMDVLRSTLAAIANEAGKRDDFIVHYAVKANANPRILRTISQAGLGADCVSGGEVQAALDAGFPASEIVFAGVGKSDWEINLGLDNDIRCFNVESIAELKVINELAEKKDKLARVAFRINPEIGAHTHSNITTGTAENKFGIAMNDLEKICDISKGLSNIVLTGIHFHIGSQILDMGDFRNLCNRINDIQDWFETRHIRIDNINVGGGLGVEYHHPEKMPIPNFSDYFSTFAQHLRLRQGQKVHFELGRAVVAQCGALITKVLYIKQGVTKQFACVDAGFTDLIRPALYQAYHKIVNISRQEKMQTYDVVGPICESTDVFAKAREINECKRGDLLAILTAGAYGEIMASQYNCRRLPQAVFSE